MHGFFRLQGRRVYISPSLIPPPTIYIVCDAMDRCIKISIQIKYQSIASHTHYIYIYTHTFAHIDANAQYLNACSSLPIILMKMISAEAPILFAKAAEAFIRDLTIRAWQNTEEFKRRTLQARVQESIGALVAFHHFPPRPNYIFVCAPSPSRSFSHMHLSS